MLKILFTGGGGAGNEAIFRLLEGRYQLYFADADIKAIHPAIPIERTHQIPFASESRYNQELSDLANMLGLNIIIPGVDEELLQVLALENESNGINVLAPHPDYAKLMLDKLAFAQELSYHGLVVPKTVLLNDADLVGFPCFSKPRMGRGSREIRILKNKDQAVSFSNFMATNDDQIIVQEFLQGQEYTVMMAADSRANLHAIVPIMVELKRGITIRAQTVTNDEVIKSCHLIHKALPTKGCYNIQLIQKPNGQVFPFEINPRISTTFCLGVAAGVDPIAIYKSVSPPKKLLSYISGVTLRRSWTNEILTK